MKLFSRLLKFIERYVGVDMKYITNNGFWLVLSQIVTGLQTLLITILLANKLSQDTLGEYRLAISALSILLLFSMPGMQTAIMESTPKGFTNNLVIGIKSKIKFGLIGSIVAFAISAYYILSNNTNLALIFISLALFIPFFDSATLYTQQLHSLKKFKRAAIYNIIVKLILLLSLTCTIFLFDVNALVLILLFLISQTALNAFFTKKTISSLEPTPKPCFDTGLIPYAKHLSVMSILLIIATHLDQILVWHFIGATELAVFFMAMAIPQEFLRFASLLPSLAFPKFAVADIAHLRLTLMSKLWKYFAVIVVIVALYILLAPYLFMLLFPTYTNAIIYTQVLALIILQSPFLIIKTFFNATKSIKTLYILSTVFPIIRISLGLVLVVLFGLWGIVSAILIEALLRNIFLVMSFLKERQIDQETHKSA